MLSVFSGVCPTRGPLETTKYKAMPHKVMNTCTV